jgi:outer membrane murein-binding lipoprotein Lpp
VTRRLVATGALAGVVLLAGCSSGGSVEDVSSASVGTLRADVFTLSQAAAAHDWTAARRALRALHSDLALAVQAGGVSATQAEQIRADAAAVAADITARVAPATRTPTPTKTSSSAPPPTPGKKHHHKKEHGDG